MPSITRVRILTVLSKQNKLHFHWLLLHFTRYCFHFLCLFLRNSFYVLERMSFCYITIYILVSKTFHSKSWPDNLRVCRCPSFGKKIYKLKLPTVHNKDCRPISCVLLSTVALFLNFLRLSVNMCVRYSPSLNTSNLTFGVKPCDG